MDASKVLGSCSIECHIILLASEDQDKASNHCPLATPLTERGSWSLPDTTRYLPKQTPTFNRSFHNEALYYLCYRPGYSCLECRPSTGGPYRNGLVLLCVQCSWIRSRDLYPWTRCSRRFGRMLTRPRYMHVYMHPSSTRSNPVTKGLHRARPSSASGNTSLSRWTASVTLRCCGVDSLTRTRNDYRKSDHALPCGGNSDQDVCEGRVSNQRTSE
ncbi:hypothetical protein AG1IA_02913 [Rhizoctonia solani AG-1 IA]|uniref:Uncharacterized protein n=1 Tax=Thanatephorus cucumeris (strain AG1-IA) TaxID=983506 RepID=L8X352_THACA|nr:hypothetical protein AG1IA_02913 [Rhizoctonia solani AG-1 IA]